MSKKAAKRRRALEQRKAAIQPQRRPARRSALERHRTAGGYASLFSQAPRFSPPRLWNSFSADPVQAQTDVAGIQATNKARAALFLDRVEILPPEVHAEVPPEVIEEALPPQTGMAMQADVQALGAGLDDVTVAPFAEPGTFEPRGIVSNVNITFYDCADQGFCGAMYNGRKVYEGAAACSWNLPIGTRFVIVGDPTHRIYTCEDRGLLANTWVDIFWYHPNQGHSWQSIVGRYGTIEIVWTP